MPPLDGDLPGVGVYAQGERITLTGNPVLQQRPKWPGLLKVRMTLQEGEYIPATSGPFYNFIEWVNTLANKPFEDRIKPGCYASVQYIAEYKRLKCSKQTIRNYIAQAVTLGLLIEEEGGGIKTNSGWTNLLRTTPKCAFWLANDGEAIWWRPRASTARGQKAGPRGSNPQPAGSNDRTETPGHQGQTPRNLKININERTARKASANRLSQQTKPATPSKKTYLWDSNAPRKVPPAFVSTPENPTAFIDQLPYPPDVVALLREAFVGVRDGAFIFDGTKVFALRQQFLRRFYPDTNFVFEEPPLVNDRAAADTYTGQTAIPPTPAETTESCLTHEDLVAALDAFIEQKPVTPEPSDFREYQVPVSMAPVSPVHSGNLQVPAYERGEEEHQTPTGTVASGNGDAHPAPDYSVMRAAMNHLGLMPRVKPPPTMRPISASETGAFVRGLISGGGRRVPKLQSHDGRRTRKPKVRERLTSPPAESAYCPGKRW